MVPGVTAVTLTGGEPSSFFGDNASWDKLYVVANCLLRSTEVFGFSRAESRMEVDAFFLPEFGVTSRCFNLVDLLRVIFGGV